MTQFVLAELRARRRMVAGLGAGAFTLLAFFGLSYESLAVHGLQGAFGADPPRIFTAFSGSRGGDLLSPHGWMGFAFNHPLFLVVTLTVSISVGAGAIAGEVDGGRSELLFTAPVARARFLAAALVVWLVAEVAVMAAGWAGALFGALWSDDLRRAGLGTLAWGPVQYLPLALFVAACAFAASALSRTRERAMGAAVGVAVLGYLLNVVSGLIGSLGWVRWLSPFGYYDPGQAVTGGLRLAPAAVLVLASAVLLAVTRLVLEHRDLA